MERGKSALIRMTICLTGLVVILVFALNTPVAACTGFVIGKGTHRLFGRSYDWTFGDGYVMVNKRGVAKGSYPSAIPGEKGQPARWISKYGSVTFNQYGLDFPMGGINEAGLVVASMALMDTKYPVSGSRHYIASALLWIQYILDTCATTEDVLKSAAKVRIAADASKGIGLHFLVMDRKGNAAAIEFLNGRMVVHRGNKLPVIVLTNSRYENALSYWKYRSFPVPDKWFSIHRFSTAANMIRYASRLKPKSNLNLAFDVLTAVTWRMTRWNIVYDNHEMKIYFRTNMNPKIRTIDVRAFNFSCKTPVKVLNLNAKLSGNVTRDFVNYTPAINMNLVKTSFEKLRPIMNVPMKAVEALGRYPDACACVK